MRYFRKNKEKRPLYDERWFFPEIDRPGVLRRWIIGTFALITFGSLMGEISGFISNFINLFYSWASLSAILLLFFKYGSKHLQKIPISWTWFSCSIVTICVSFIISSLKITNDVDNISLFYAGELFRNITFVLLLLFFFDGQHRRGSPSWAKARLDALQSRMRPHFLFNVLNNVAEIVQIDANLAEEAILDLAELSRAMLQQQPEVKSVQEKTNTEAYLRLEKIRLGKRLNVVWEWDIAPEIKMPSLFLQPLVENAIKHGIEPHKTEEPIIIKGWEEKNYINIVVSNPVTSDIPNTAGHGVTLPNIAERLEWLYPNHYRFRTREIDNKFEVIIRIPLIK